MLRAYKSTEEGSKLSVGLTQILEMVMFKLSIEGWIGISLADKGKNDYHVKVWRY